jgi:AcrR family transcriptional regulator
LTGRVAKIKKTDRSVFLMRRPLPKISDLKRESRRQQVLDAALACFSENGFHQTGMADIVRRSGMSHGAVYGYFQSKDDIIEALADDRHVGEALLNSVVEQEEDPIEAIHALVRAYAHWLIAPDGELTRRVGVHGWAEALRSNRVHARVIEGIDVPRSMIADLVGKAQRAGRLSSDLSAEAIARTFIALFQGLVLQVAWGEEIDIESCVAVVDRMLRGLGQFDRQAKARRTRRA